MEDGAKSAGVRCTIDWATGIILALALCGLWALGTQTHASNTRQSINRSVVAWKNRSDKHDVNTLGLRRMRECTSHRRLSQHDLPIVKSFWWWWWVWWVWWW
jgi:hypothetical protein